MTRLRLIAYSLILAFFTGTGVLIAVSLVPYLHFIGVISLVLLSFIVLCGIRLLWAYTGSTTRQLYHRGNVVVSGDIVAYHTNSGFIHLSAQHEEAKVRIKEIAAPIIEEIEETPEFDDETVLTMYNKLGNSLRDIVKATGLSYYKVQKIVANQKKPK